MSRILFLVIALISASSAFAGWHSVGGTVTSIAVYSSNDMIIFDMSNPGATVSGCSVNGNSFSIDSAVPADRRKQMLSVILAAKTSGEVIAVAYDDTNCATYSGSTTFRSVKRITH